MKGKFRNHYYIDTNIFKNINGFDDESGSLLINKKYKKDLLEKFINNHICYLSPYNLYEILKDKRISRHNILDNIVSFNFCIKTDISNPLLSFLHNIKAELYDNENINIFLNYMKEELRKYASDFYGAVLAFPILVYLNSALKLLHNKERIQSDVRKTYEIIKNSLYKTTDVSNKTKFENNIKNHYKNITKYLIESINKHCVKDKVSEEIAMSFLRDLNCSLEQCDLSIYKSQSNKISAHDIKVNNNFLSELFKGFCNYKGININMLEKEDGFVTTFKTYMKMSVYKIYPRTTENKIYETYFCKAIVELYIKRLKNDGKKDIIYFTTNDFIDMLSLIDAQHYGYPYLTTDKNIYKSVFNIFTNKEKKFIKDFIVYDAK